MSGDFASEASSRWYRAGVRLLKLGLYAEALRFFDRALTTHPQSEVASDIWTSIGQCQESLGHPDEALQSVDRALTLNPEHTGAFCLRAEILAGQGHYQAALEAAEHATKISPKDSNTWAMQSRIFHLAGRDDEALLADKQALHLDPDNIWARQGQVKVLIDSGQYNDALDACNRALTVQTITATQHAHLLASKAHILYNLGRHEEALAASEEAIQMDGAQPHTWELMGDSLGMLHRYSEALDAENKALQLDPKSPTVWGAKGKWLYFLDRQLEALAAYDEALCLAGHGRVTSAPTTSAGIPTTSTVQVVAEAVRGRAHVLAVMFIRHILPDDIELTQEDALQDKTIWREVGELLAWQHRDDEALAVCAEVQARDPYDFSAHKLEWRILWRRHQYLKAFKVLWRVARFAHHLRESA